MVKDRRRILLAVDGSEQAFEAVRYVSRLLPPDRIEVVLFHVMTKVPESFWDMEKEPTLRQELGDTGTWESQQKKEIQEFMERARCLFWIKTFPRMPLVLKSRKGKWASQETSSMSHKKTTTEWSLGVGE